MRAVQRKVIERDPATGVTREVWRDCGPGVITAPFRGSQITPPGAPDPVGSEVSRLRPRAQEQLPSREGRRMSADHQRPPLASQRGLVAASEHCRAGSDMGAAVRMPESPRPYRLFVNADRTHLVRVWAEGRVEVSTRSEAGAIWGPPVVVKEETP